MYGCPCGGDKIDMMPGEEGVNAKETAADYNVGSAMKPEAYTELAN